MLYTTLKLCKENNACSTGYRDLIKSLPKDCSATEPIPLTHVIKSNGYEDAIWALRAITEPCRDFITNYAVWCAEQVLEIYEKKHPNDKRVRESLKVLKNIKRGKYPERI